MNELPLDKAGVVDYMQWRRIIVDEGRRPDIPSWIPPEVSTVIKQGWNNDPEARCTAQELFEALESMGSIKNQEFVRSSITNRFFEKRAIYISRI